MTPEFPPKAEFCKWLRSLPPDEVVAEDWSCFTCPIATWLFMAGIAAQPYIRPANHIMPGVWRPDDEDTSAHPLPEWANKFGAAIDKRDPFLPVTAADCLRVLARTRE